MYWKRIKGNHFPRRALNNNNNNNNHKKKTEKKKKQTLSCVAFYMIGVINISSMKIRANNEGFDQAARMFRVYTSLCCPHMF